MTNHTNGGDVLSQVRTQRKANAIRFDLGQIVATPAAVARLAKYGFNATDLIARHHTGNWGDVSEPDARRNEQALTSGSRLLSVYQLVEEKWLQSVPRNERSRLPTIWIQTNAANEEGVRDATTILCPEDW